MITRAGLADEIDGLDLQIKALNEMKSDAYRSYREQLEDAGMEPRRASAEVAATKAAIVKRRKLRENPDAAREKDDLIDAILFEIMERPSRAREEGRSYAAQKIAEGLKEALSIAKGEADPASISHSHSPAPAPAPQAPQADKADEAVKSSAALSVNPLCARPDTCQFAHSMASCSACAHVKSRTAA